mgnify:CR=1 FL=1
MDEQIWVLVFTDGIRIEVTKETFHEITDKSGFININDKTGRPYMININQIVRIYGKV